MTTSIGAHNQVKNIIAVIRVAGERTFEGCKAIVLKQVPKEWVYVVNERPFEAALRKSYEIGIESNANWLMTVDADVFLREGAVYKLLSGAEGLPGHYFQIEGLVYDKLTGMYREAGHRMYRTKYLETALQNIPANNREIRPEYTTLQRMESLGFPSMKINTVFGVHDYEQFYRDIYRKAYVHANKHQIWLPQLVLRWKNLANQENDFRIALRGLYDGLLSLNTVKIDTRDYAEAADTAMGDLALQEKPALSDKEIDFKKIEAILEGAGEIPNNQNSKSLEAKLERFKMRYTRIGALRMAPYFLGALLCDIGTKIKQLAEKGKPA